MALYSFYLKKDVNNLRRGVSPVVATVILVAVAVVIAAALAGFSSSILGTYSGIASVEIKSMRMDVGGAGAIEMKNNGAVSDSVESIHVPGTLTDGTTDRIALVDDGTFNSIWVDAGTADCAANAEAPEIDANSKGIICFADADMETGTDGFTISQQVTVRIKMSSGTQLTQNVVVHP
ncbi:MAG: archaellin/type IV pilin N-terminal domain-containing protein [Nitrososphaerales archaeon]